MWFLFYKEVEVLEEKNCRTIFLPLLLIYITKSLLKILTPFHYLSITSSHPVLRQCNTNNIFSYSLFVFRKSMNADFLSMACAFIQKHLLKSKDDCNQGEQNSECSSKSGIQFGEICIHISKVFCNVYPAHLYNHPELEASRTPQK